MEHEAFYSFSSSNEVKRACSYIPISTLSFIEFFFEHKENLTVLAGRKVNKHSFYHFLSSVIVLQHVMMLNSWWTEAG